MSPALAQLSEEIGAAAEHDVRPVAGLHRADSLDDVALDMRRVRAEHRSTARRDVLRRLPPEGRELALDVGGLGVVEVEVVPVLHDVVHDAAH